MKAYFVLSMVSFAIYTVTSFTDRPVSKFETRFNMWCGFLSLFAWLVYINCFFIMLDLVYGG